MTELEPSASAKPPSGKRLLGSALAAAAVAAVVLVIAVLPAEYGIDPTGAGRALGLDKLRAPPARTIEVKDVIGGNERVREVEIPDAGEPTPLPNPAIHQAEDRPIQTRTVTVTLPVDGETEIKAIMRESKAILYSWQTDGAPVYTDFHGHDPAVGGEFFVRYREDQDGVASATGSLVAPFDGEHGWYWLNIDNKPVTITLTLTGFFDDIKDYGIHSNSLP
ncbi:MAG TPA: hypothetical protein VFO94_01870 [Gammaproteobacteria bacterium]|jgi:hypothetical protein|nr:hypothetical protein [Gammaproteobacteria bacterium]